MNIFVFPWTAAQHQTESHSLHTFSMHNVNEPERKRSRYDNNVVSTLGAKSRPESTDSFSSPGNWTVKAEWARTYQRFQQVSANQTASDAGQGHWKLGGHWARSFPATLNQLKPFNTDSLGLWTVFFTSSYCFIASSLPARVQIGFYWAAQRLMTTSVHPSQQEAIGDLQHSVVGGPNTCNNF